MRRIIIDLDGTLTVDSPDVDYWEKPVNLQVVARLREYKNLGFEVVVFTARNMRTYQGRVDLIRANTLPLIETWLVENNIPFDEIVVGKPWCGTDGFYVDDRAIRPDEFARMSPNEAREFFDDGGD